MRQGRARGRPPAPSLTCNVTENRVMLIKIVMIMC